MNQDHFNQKAIKRHRDEKYKQAYKAATREYAENRKNGVDGLLGNGARAIADRWNSTFLTSPNDRPLKKSVIHEAVVYRKETGVSPPKRGRPTKVGAEITGQLSRHAAMMQASGLGEAKYSLMRGAIEAMTVGTEHEGTLDPIYTFRKARMEHPDN